MIKGWNQFLGESKSYREVKKICDWYDIKNWSLNPDGSIDVDGDVVLRYLDLKELPLKFNRVSGYFDCSNNQLTSLLDSPREIRGGFFCNNNQLTSLSGSPREVGGGFYCHFNKLTDLVGSPQEVANFYCYNNPIYSFKGLEDTIIGDYLDLPTHLKKVWKLFRDKGEIETIMDYDPFRMVDGKPALDIDRLNQFLIDIGKKPVEGVEGWISIF
jgi:hypothetical protein